MSDADNNEPKDTNTTAGTYTTAPPKKKKTSDAVAKVSKEELEKSIYRKKWIDRVSMILLASALGVYFIVLIISMIASSNSTMVEKEDVEKEMATPAAYVEFLSDSEDPESNPFTCSVEVYSNDTLRISGTFTQTATKSHFNADAEITAGVGWTIMNLTQYNYSGVIFMPPDDSILKVERGIKNHIDVDCSTSNMTVFVNLYYPGQYDQYEDEEQDLIDAIAYDAVDSKMGYETDYDMTWYTVSDELQFASKPQDLDGIDGAFDYYEMSLSGVFPLSTAQGPTNCKTGYALYRKHTKYIYQDATTFADVVAAIGGMYTSLASILAYFLARFIWGYEFKIYTWKIYKWTGYAPHAPKTKEGEEKEEEGGEDEDA
jgi:hypothetical protein